MATHRFLFQGMLAFCLVFTVSCSLPKDEPSPTPQVTQEPTREATPTAEPISCPETADIIFHNGNIITIEKSQPIAQAISIRGSLILAVGTDEEILACQGPGTTVIDLHGKTIMPGISDGHSHYVRNAFEAGVPLEEIQYNLLRFGLTGDTEMHSVDQFIHDMLQAEQNGELDIRLNIFASYNCGFLEDGKSIECISWYKDNPPILDPTRMVRIPGVKIFADGAGTPARGCPYYSFPFEPEVVEVWPECGKRATTPTGTCI